MSPGSDRAGAPEAERARIERRGWGQGMPPRSRSPWWSDASSAETIQPRSGPRYRGNEQTLLVGRFFPRPGSLDARPADLLASPRWVSKVPPRNAALGVEGRRAGGPAAMLRDRNRIPRSAAPAGHRRVAARVGSIAAGPATASAQERLPSIAPRNGGTGATSMTSSAPSRRGRASIHMSGSVSRPILTGSRCAPSI